MKKHTKTMQLIFTLGFAISLLVSACAPSAIPAPTQDSSTIQTQAAQTVIADMTANAPAPTQLPASTEPSQPTQPPPGPTPDPAIPVGVIPTPAPGEPAAVAKYNTTIYSGPGVNYVVYAAFLGSATAKVIGVSEDSQWWVISVPPAANEQGWVSAGWVTVSNVDSVPVVPTPPVPPTTGLIPPGPNDPQVTAIVNAYVRTGPGANYPAYGIANAGATGRVIGKSEDGSWWVVRLDPAIVGSGHGWVMAQYTQAQNVADVPVINTPQASAPEKPPAPPAGSPSATAADYVNVRSGPGTNYPVLVVAPPGASGEVSGKSANGQWWQVKISNRYAADGFGWVSAAYVITQNTDGVPMVEGPAAPPVVNPTPPAEGSNWCVVASQTPADSTVFSSNALFETTWVLKNAGTEKWDQNEIDIAYASALNNVILHSGADRYDLTNTVEPSWTYNFTTPMIAPLDPGSYGELWQVVQGSNVVCQFYVYVAVQ